MPAGRNGTCPGTQLGPYEIGAQTQPEIFVVPCVSQWLEKSAKLLRGRIGGLAPGTSHHSFTTSSEKPPLSNFNSYPTIPRNGRHNHIEV
jgi:hypothetical protein